VNKSIILLLLLLCSSLVLAADYEKYYNERFSSYTWENMGQPISNSFLSYFGVKAGAQKTAEGLFYTVKQWEFDVCTAGVTDDFNAYDNSATAGSSTEVSMLYGPVTATITAQKYSYSKNESLYEVAWYIQPKDAELTYSVYLMTKNKKKYYIPGVQNVVADPAQGDSGFYAEYLDKEYVQAVIVLTKGAITSSKTVTSTSEKQILNTTIFENPYGAVYGKVS
jgi:hypothetical protein